MTTDVAPERMATGPVVPVPIAPQAPVGKGRDVMAGLAVTAPDEKLVPVVRVRVETARVVRVRVARPEPKVDPPVKAETPALASAGLPGRGVPRVKVAQLAPRPAVLRSSNRAAPIATPAVAGLPEEQRPVAEQLLKGGVKAVRDALTAQGIDPAAIVTMAENLNPVLRAAEWRDRADAAAADLQAVPLRELRAIVTAAGDAAKGEESKTLAASLKTALASRQEALRTEWVDGIKSAIEGNRPLRALRQASRTAGPGSRMPAELAVQLAQAAGAALTKATPPQRWLDVLEAVVASPVSRTVKPEGLPENAPEELLSKARAAAGAVPALAALLGMSVPPPPPRRAVPPPPRPRPRPTVAAAPKPEPKAEEPKAEEPKAEVEEPKMEQGKVLEAPSADEADPAVVGVLGDDVQDAVVVQELDQAGDDVQG